MVSHVQPATSIEMKDYIARETLRNGRNVIIRAIRADDKAILQELMRHLSAESRFFRFFTAKDTLTERELSRFTEIDFSGHVGLLASVLEPDAKSLGAGLLPESVSGSTALSSLRANPNIPGAGINASVVPAGTGRYIICKGDNSRLSAELSFAVEEEFQGLGIGTLLLKHLTMIARAKGINKFVAYVLADNEKMLDVFAHCGLAMTQSKGESGVIEVILSLSQPESTNS